MSSVDDPLLKELLSALKEDTHRMASDLLSAITTLALIAVFALFLAVVSLVRIFAFEIRSFPGPGPGIGGGQISLMFETALTLVLFALSIVSIYNLLRLREKYLRLQILAAKLGR
ncbi:MAG TPA: hypothetical protein VE955_00740 [Candidatus Dormibacteraeota bacterium]|jgi:hypothetical protein|nr:hypothetical protein [Candidatus Dormibacteraeota bacterium]